MALSALPSFSGLMIRTGLDRVWFDPADMSTWNAASLLANGSAKALSELLGRFDRQSGPAGARPKAMGLNGLAGYTSLVLERQNLSDTPLARAILPRARQEWAAMVRRTVALDAMGTPEEPVLLIKGAAMAKTAYPRESLRTSGDIDAVISPERARALDPEGYRRTLSTPFGKDHIPPVLLMGFTVEYHFRFGLCSGWGSHEDLIRDAREIRPGLLVPAPHVSLTICLLHFVKHNWPVWDTLDIALLLEGSGFDWTELESYWREYGLLPHVLPAMLLLSPVIAAIPDAFCRRLERSLDHRDRRFVSMVCDCMRTTRFRTIKSFHLKSAETRIPFPRKCLRAFFSTREETELYSGASKSPRALWFRHTFTRRAERVAKFFKGLVSS